MSKKMNVDFEYFASFREKGATNKLFWRCKGVKSPVFFIMHSSALKYFCIHSNFTGPIDRLM